MIEFDMGVTCSIAVSTTDYFSYIFAVHTKIIVCFLKSNKNNETTVPQKLPKRFTGIEQLSIYTKQK